MKAKLLPVLEDCIECGLKMGFTRAFKHDDAPSEERIFQIQQDAIMEQIYERFDFDDQCPPCNQDCNQGRDCPRRRPHE